MDYIIINNSGGYHGHQIKDVLGGQTIGLLLGLTFRPMRYPYLAHFGLNDHAQGMGWWKRHFGYKHVRKVRGPIWDGFTDHQEAMDYFSSVLDAPEDTLLSFEQALRIHPHQTIPWYRDGRIETDIWRTIVDQTTANYQLRNRLKSASGPVRVAIHVSRGVDYNRDRFPEHFSDSYNVRFMFDMSYFLRIIEQIESVIGAQNLAIDVYTESLNSEDVVGAFAQMSHVSVHIGDNRKQKNHRQIHGIFDRFVEADILVTCNSSFSSMCSYFRGGKTTIYHPHLHLDHLPAPEYLATDVEGNFDSGCLSRIRS